jgi:Rps23 Pro-64 3,4-dihydroxylase Tpa1-like proline 4-hydroxylase
MLTDDNVLSHQEAYLTADPYPHIVIDNFLRKEYVDELVTYAKSLNKDNCSNKRFNQTTQHKYAFQDYHKYPDKIRQIFDYFTSQDFVQKIETLTGISNLVTENNTLEGGGFHKIGTNGFLNLHTDFNNYKDRNLGSLDRRINLLLYLNPEWQDDYNGKLWICDKEKKTIVKQIAPIVNRCVIFSTTSKSVHGHPEPLKTPVDVTRDSLALYYYTLNTNGNKCFENHSFHASGQLLVDFFDALTRLRNLGVGLISKRCIESFLLDKRSFLRFYT